MINTPPQTEAKDFFDSLGFSYAQIKDENYAILDSVSFEKLGLKIPLDKFDKVSCDLATLLDDYQKKLQELDSWHIDFNYNSQLKHFNVGQQSPLSCMRLGYVVDINGLPKLIEVNAQTPSFWWECEDGSDAVLHYLKKSPRKVDYQANLSAMFSYQLQQCSKLLNKSIDTINVGLITCNSKEDIFQMEFVKSKIKSLKMVNNIEVLAIECMDINTEDQIFSLNSKQTFDVVFLWYPLEWLLEEKFNDGSEVASCLNKVLQKNNAVIFNGLEAFITQNKNLFGFITENWDEVEKRQLDQFFTPSYYTQTELESDLGKTQWLGKPIWGRQGMGIFGQDKISQIEGDLSDQYYNNQNCIYQPFHDLMPLVFKDTFYNFTLEKWVYKTENGWQAGGHSLRITKDYITGDNSSWLTLS
jgi:glutathionylspermidine synthase